MIGNRAQSHFNQENPINRYGTTPSNKNSIATAGKGLKGLQTTGQPNRILGKKDENRSTASLLFTAPSKVSTSTSCSNLTKSTNFNSTLQLLPSYLRTPSPNVHKFASFSLSPGLDEDLVVENNEEFEEDLGDREVELSAGSSSRNYEEPFQAQFELPNFSTANYGRLLKAVPMQAIEDDWAEWDAEERRTFQADIPVENIVLNTLPIDDSIAFPMPKRVAFSSKSSNSSIISTTSSLRKPLVPSKTISRVPSSTFTRPLSATSLLVSTKPTSRASLSKPKWGAPTLRPESVSKPLRTSTTITPRQITTVKPISRIVKPESRLVAKKNSTTLLKSVLEVPNNSLIGTNTEEIELGIFGIYENNALNDLLDLTMIEVDEPFSFSL